jgi:hypothetical protein
MDLVEKTVLFFETIESKDFYKLGKMITDDFQYVGPTPDPFNKETWLDFQRAIQAAFPDWAYNIEKVEKLDQTKVEVKVHITGTHTKELALPIAGIRPLPATGKKIQMPLERAVVSFKGEKICKLHVYLSYKGSLPGLLQQLGLE